MRKLSDLELDISYRSDEGNVVADFYVPCLVRSQLYRRAAGYFTSNGLALAAKGIAHLTKAGGTIRLVVSPHLTDADIDAIERGYKSRDELFRELAIRELSDAEDALVNNRLSALAWLISTGALDIKLAFRIDPSTGRLRRGIYHEKIGIFSDSADNHVAFTGSQNETEGGLVENFESIDVYCSWIDAKRVARKIDAFEDLWSNKTQGLSVVDFTRVSREALERFKKSIAPEFDPEFLSSIEHDKTFRPGDLRPHIPLGVTLRGYQKQAINNWLKANGQGILRLATGTGKTITGLGLIIRLIKDFGLRAVVIVCPYKHLVTQWARECERFSFKPILAFENRASWFDDLTERLSNALNDEDGFACVVTTNATLASDGFKLRLPYFPAKTLIIGDEVHNLGSQVLAKSLPDTIRLRLGLSATPERWFDPDGTERINAYFGEILEPQLGIKEAIEMGVLVPYRYFPILVELTEEEREQYLELSTRIARQMAVHGDDTENTALNNLLIQRARLTASASNKLVALRELAARHRDTKHMLFYCGDGTVENPEDHYYERQLDAVLKLLGGEFGIRVAPYIAETDLSEREQLKDDLACGRLQGLVAIRCLDEGVDIPSISTAIILASSTNPRQFIQRRGRVLRRADGKDSATVYDMIIVPPEEAISSESERSLLRKELVRFREFADIALNAGEALGSILDLQRKFDLMDV